jgi:hypothetical protein
MPPTSFSYLELGWPMAGFGALAVGCGILAWVFSFEARALRGCGLSWADILSLPDWRLWMPTFRPTRRRAMLSAVSR